MTTQKNSTGTLKKDAQDPAKVLDAALTALSAISSERLLDLLFDHYKLQNETDIMTTATYITLLKRFEQLEGKRPVTAILTTTDAAIVKSRDMVGTKGTLSYTDAVGFCKNLSTEELSTALKKASASKPLGGNDVMLKAMRDVLQDNAMKVVTDATASIRKSIPPFKKRP